MDKKKIITETKKGIYYIFDYSIPSNFDTVFYKIGVKFKNTSHFLDKKEIVLNYIPQYQVESFDLCRYIEWKSNLINYLNKYLFNNQLENISWAQPAITPWKNYSNYKYKRPKCYFNFYMNNKFKFSYTYYLGPGETSNMALFKLNRLYPDFFIQEISKPSKTFIHMSRKIDLIKSLRDTTLGSFDTCGKIIKELLDTLSEETDEKILKLAIVKMNEENMAKANKKQNREVDENASVILFETLPFNAEATIIKISCETEQGATALKTQFSEELNKIKEIAVEMDIAQPHYIEDLLNEDYDEASLIEMKLREISGTIGEKVKITRFEKLWAPEDVPNTYTKVHIQGNSVQGNIADRHGSGIIYNTKSKEVEEIIRTLLNQLTWANPLVFRESELPKSILEDKKEELLKDIAKSNIPDNRKDQVLQGKLNAFKKEAIFELQPVVFDFDQEFTVKSKKIIKQLLEKYQIEIFDYVNI